MADPLPNRTEALPEERIYYPSQGDSWSPILRDVLRELSINSVVSGPNRSAFEPFEGQLYIPTTTGGRVSIGNGAGWDEIVATQFGALPAVNGSVPIKTTFTSGVRVNTASGANPLEISRGSKPADELITVGVSDGTVSWQYDNDESSSSIEWTINANDTENNDGANANSKKLSAKTDTTGGHLRWAGNDIWHEGNMDRDEVQNPWKSVTEHGAAGDSTADDTAEIQAALNSGASTVHLPEGTYNITAPIDVGNVHLTGEGKGKSVINVSAQMSPGVTVYGVGGGVSDLTVQGNGNTPVGVRMGANETFCENVEVDNVTQYGTITETVACIAAFSCVDAHIENCVATRASAPNTGVSRGIQVDGSGGGDVLVDGNRVDDVTPVGDGDGIVVQGGNDNSRVVNNRVTNAAKSAIKVNVAKHCSVTGNTLHAGADALAVMRVQASGTSFTGNTITVPTCSGELVRVSDSAAGVTISGNTLEMTAGIDGLEGIQVDASTSAVTISGNSIYMNGTGFHGISAAAASDVVIDGNNIHDPGERGIELKGTQGSTVNGNIVRGAANNGILITSASAEVLIDGNIFNSATTAINNHDSVATIGDNLTP